MVVPVGVPVVVVPLDAEVELVVGSVPGAGRFWLTAPKGGVGKAFRGDAVDDPRRRQALDRRADLADQQQVIVRALADLLDLLDLVLRVR